MKAVTYQGFKHVKVKEVQNPKLEKDDDIVINVTSTSICGSDLHLYHGLIPSLEKDYIIGHEAIGIVSEVGKAIDHVKKGDKVIIPYTIGCGECFYCHHSLDSQCDNANIEGEIGACYGYSRLLGDFDGCLAEQLRVPFANFNPILVPNNCEIDDDLLLLMTDALPTAYWAIENSGLKSGDTVIILGSGPIGLLTQKLAWLKGAERVIVVDRVDYRLQHAQNTNKVETYHFDKTKELPFILKEITNGGADVVIDCVGMSGKMKPVEIVETALRLQGGSLQTIELASQIVRKGGTVQLIGIYGTRYNTFPLGDFYIRNITLKMGLAPVKPYFQPLYAMLNNEKLDPRDIISHRISLEAAEEGFQMFNNRSNNCLKIILKP